MQQMAYDTTIVEYTLYHADLTCTRWAEMGQPEARQLISACQRE